MTPAIGTFRIGETIAVALDIVSGTVPDGLTVTAVMRRGHLFGTFEPMVAAVPVALLVTPRAAAGDIPAGWNLTLDAEASADLLPGAYGIDARLVDGETVEITDMTAVIRLTRAVTA